MAFSHGLHQPWANNTIFQHGEVLETCEKFTKGNLTNINTQLCMANTHSPLVNTHNLLANIHNQLNLICLCHLINTPQGMPTPNQYFPVPNTHYPPMPFVYVQYPYATVHAHVTQYPKVLPIHYVKYPLVFPS